MFVVLEILVDILQGGMDRRSWMLVNFVPPIGVGSEEPREVLLEGGDGGGDVGRGALELLYQGMTLAFLKKESQTWMRIFARVSMMILKAISGEAGIMILSSKQVSDGSCWLYLGGVSEREVSLVLGGTVVI
jgi:hypothetical protein